jgi:hypothetical protein
LGSQHDLSVSRKKVHVSKILPPPWGLLPSWRRLAVGPIPPAGWDTRSTSSHLGKRPEHEIPDFCSRRGGLGLGGALHSGPGLAEKGWGPRGLGFESVPGGAPIGSTGGGRGRPKEHRPRKAKTRLERLARIQCGGHCRALALLLRRSHQSSCSGWMCSGSYCTSAVAPQVLCGGNLALQRFNDWRVSAGARSGALPSPGARSHQSTTPRARIDGKNRCTRCPT